MAATVSATRDSLSFCVSIISRSGMPIDVAALDPAPHRSYQPRRPPIGAKHSPANQVGGMRWAVLRVTRPQVVRIRPFYATPPRLNTPATLCRSLNPF